MLSPDLKVITQGQKITLKMRNYPTLLNQHRLSSTINKQKRKNITTFSEASKKRIQRKLASIDYKTGLFITLTALESPTMANLRAFIKRLKRICGNKITVIWKKELQKRGVVHYHLMIINTKRWISAKWITRVWGEIIGQPHPSTDITFVDNRKKFAKYITKYITKVEKKGEQSEPCYLEKSIISGRYWGIEGSAFIKYLPKKTIKFSDLPQDIQFHFEKIIDYLSQDNIKPDNITIVWWSYV